MWEWGHGAVGHQRLPSLSLLASSPRSPAGPGFARRSPKAGPVGAVLGGGPWGLHRPGGSTPGRFQERTSAFVSQTWGNTQSVGQKGHLMGSVILRRPHL